MSPARWCWVCSPVWCWVSCCRRPWQLVVGTGLLGGYTTFSTASVETVQLLDERRWRAALVNGFGVLIIATLAAGLGYLVGVRV